MEFVIRPPSGVLSIIRKLKEHGHEAYAVGGCVRDSALGIAPEDWDIAADALPADVKALFTKTVDTGMKHGTVTVQLNEAHFEVTTFRIDGFYGDGRHPDQVIYTGRLEEDLSRRDFTINAMAWNEEKGLVDPFGGLSDIAGARIRTVGAPKERFHEDALRMLRAVRFAARLDFDIDAETFGAIRESSGLIVNVSSERIREEMTAILTSKNPAKFSLLLESGLLKLILPEAEACFQTPQHNPHHIYNVGEHSLRAVAAIENDKNLRWTMLLHDVGKAVTRFTDDKGIDHFYGHPEKSVAIAEAIMRRLKFDNKSMERILRLVKHHDREILPRPKAVAKAVHAIGGDIFLDLLKVKRADKLAQKPSDVRKGLEHIETVERIYFELLEKGSCLSLKDLAIDGHDLIAIGFREGSEIGKTLSVLLGKVLEDPALNKKNALLEISRSILSKRQRQ